MGLTPRPVLVSSPLLQPLLSVQTWSMRWAVPAVVALITVQLFDVVEVWTAIALLTFFAASCRNPKAEAPRGRRELPA